MPENVFDLEKARRRHGNKQRERKLEHIRNRFTKVLGLEENRKPAKTKKEGW